MREQATARPSTLHLLIWDAGCRCLWNPKGCGMSTEPDRDGGERLAERFLAFAVGILNLVGKLPNTAAGQHVARQLLRCGTSPGANYEEARGAESRADFTHKMGIVLKELKEA